MRQALLCLALCLGLAARGARAASSFLEQLTNQANNPMYVADPGDGRLFVVERAGTIRILSGGMLQDANSPFLDVSSKVDEGGGSGEGGLLSIAFDPSFGTNRRFFVVYTRTGTGGSPLETVIASYLALDGDPNHADTSTEKILITQLSPVGAEFVNHKGGNLQFGPNDHLLYYAYGDGGSGNDPLCNAQDGTTLLGKMIRIDPNGSDPNAHPNYGIPADNPFASATDGTRPEIWARGLRNPFRYSFDRTTGDLWIGDVGQNTKEEVDRQPASSHGGENYGWKIWEGDTCNAAALGGMTNCPVSVTSCTSDSSPRDGYTFPVIDYPHSVGNVVIGGHVYRGATAAWHGRYIFADFGFGKIFVLDDPNGTPKLEVLSDGDVSGPVAIGEDHDGELYVVGLYDGTISKLHFENLSLPKAQTKCVVKLNQDFAGLADFESARIRSCLAKGATGKTTPSACLAQANPKLSKLQAKHAADDAALCMAAAPGFGYAGAAAGDQAALDAETNLAADVFGGDLDTAIVTKATDRNTFVCQQSVAKSVASCQAVRRAEFLRCKVTGLAKATITSVQDLADCLGPDAKGRIARACDPATGPLAAKVIPKACTSRGVDLAAAFPGCDESDPGALAQCLATAGECETCRLFDAADALGTGCSVCPP
ncbi:MAG TPA: PQQ-dependent sugar dehydrogenase [Myxococcota bacterium]|nr:PQQ-dependent sugar dehydrogenase [Myxococcota bacterium]